MKKLLPILLVVVLAACSRVEPNHAGVLMQNYGKAGKADFTIVTGKVNTSAWGTELYQVPLYEKRASFADNAADGEQQKDFLTLQAADKTAFTSRPSYSYKVTKDRAIDVVFNNMHLKDEDFMKGLENNVLETRIYDIMKDVNRSFTTDTLMSVRGSTLYEKTVRDMVAKAFDEVGVQLLTFTAQLEFSKKVTDKIDTRNEVNQNVSVIDQRIIEQKKQNELAALQAEENIIKSRGITPQILSQMAVEKWDGKLPATWSGSNLPFVKVIP